MIKLKKQRRRGGVPRVKHRRHNGRWWQWVVGEVKKKRRRERK